MTRLDSSRTLSGSITSEIETCAAGEQMLSSSELQEDRLGWKDAIDRKLIEWARDPSQLEDDGIEAPSREIISLACQFAIFMRDDAQPAPLRVVPDGDGGITFERKEGSLFEKIEIEQDGTIEHLRFINCRLVSRRRLL